MTHLHIHTPLVESTSLSRHLGKPVYLKMESSQPSGSFKLRGIGRLCQEYSAKGATSFVASSGGNAGLAMAYASRKLGVPAKVVIPTSTPAFMKERIESEGAQVIVHGQEWNGADVLARELAKEDGHYYIPPFDHPTIWKGHASLVHEIYHEKLKPSAILVSVGGGGLFCGIVEGLREVGWQDIPIVTAETHGAESFALALKAGELITLEKIESIAVTLGIKRVAQRAFDLGKEHKTLPQVATDQRAVEAALRFADDHRVIVEPACAVTISLIYDKAPVLEQFSTILVIICGGSGVTHDLLKNWATKLKV